MTDQPVIPDPAIKPEPKNDPAALEAKNRELLDKLAKANAKAKEAAELAAKMSELEPIKAKYDKLATIARELGVDPDKADPEKERAKLEAANREREQLAVRREAAVLRALVGHLPAGLSPRLVALAERELANDPSITYNAETGAWDGLAEARAALLQDPLFSGGTAGAPEPKAAPPPSPRLPRPGAAEGDKIDEKYANVKTFSDLHALGFQALNEFQVRHPARYAALWSEHNRRMGQVRGVPATAPILSRSN